MMRAWLGVALLSASWLLGMEYLQPPQYIAWAASLILATLLLGNVPLYVPDCRLGLFSLVLCLPAVWLVPLPHKAIPILLSAGFVLGGASIPRQWPRAWGRGALVGSLVLLVQALVLEVYLSVTARRHELPEVLTRLASFVPRLLGVDSTAEGSWLVIQGAQQPHRFAATWDLLFPPITVCFLVGGLVVLWLAAWRPAGRLWREFARNAASLLAVVLVWLIIRAGFLLALVLHRAWRAEPMAFVNAGSVLVSVWLHIALVVFLAVLVARIVRGRAAAHEPDVRDAEDNASSTETAPQTRYGKMIGAAVCGALAIGSAVVFLYWVPVGSARAGRIMFVERHSTWEPTTEPYATTIYGEAGSYNYAAAYAYCDQFFEMSRLLESDRIDEAKLQTCDVLVIKTPTARYSEEEVRAIERYVAGGGALLLIGDHTNVFNMNTYLNDIARCFGFTFRNDLLFRVADPYKQPYRSRYPSHPAVQRISTMHFAVSCSIDPAFHAGRMAIRSAGLWNLPPAYHESNYHPQAEFRPYMQYGSWCQLWATPHGQGRVLAFADSTLFSNFCVFQPGKLELLVGMLDWLNRRSRFDAGRPRMLLRGFLALVSAALLLLAWRVGGPDSFWALLCAGLLGWGVATLLVGVAHRRAMPELKPERHVPHVVIDRTISEVPLFTGAFTDGEEGQGYGMLEQWIPRVGNSISRQTDDVFGGDGLVILCPTRSVSPDYREQLVRFVESGGKLLVVDSPDVPNSTANSVLWSFDLHSNHEVVEVPDGKLQCEFPAPEVPLQMSCEIIGGQTLATLDGRPVAAQVPYGRGTVTVIGFGGLFNDAAMGFHWLPEPDAETQERYQVLYGLLRASLPHLTTETL
jgi:hypothetical protein